MVIVLIRSILTFDKTVQMKKSIKKDIRADVKFTLNDLLSSWGIFEPSEKLKRLIETQVKKLSRRISADLDKKLKKVQKAPKGVTKKANAKMNRKDTAAVKP